MTEIQRLTLYTPFLRKFCWGDIYISPSPTAILYLRSVTNGGTNVTKRYKTFQGGFQALQDVTREERR